MTAIPFVLLLAAFQAAPTGTATPGLPSGSPATSAPADVTPAPADSTLPLPASPAPSAAATPSSPPADVATALPYAYRFVPRQPDHVAAGQPQIFAVYLNSNKLKSLGPIDIKVATSPDVIKVLTVSNGRENTIPMIGPGDFEAVSKLPRLPIIASGVTTTLNFVAIGASGKRVTVPVPVMLE